MKRTLALGGAVAGMLAAAAVAAPAHAAPKDAVPTTLANTNFAAQQVVQYWIGEKKAKLVNATPYNVETTLKTRGVQSKAVTSASDKPGTVGSSGDQKAATAKTKNINLPRTVGKVFFTGSDGKPHWCSATSVQNGHKNLVATAGHCVYDVKKDKDTLDNWVFIPGYYNGKTPWGIYVGKTAYVHSDYKVFEDGDRDYAFVTVYNGVQVADGTGVDKDYKSELYNTKREAQAALRKLKADKGNVWSKLSIRTVTAKGSYGWEPAKVEAVQAANKGKDLKDPNVQLGKTWRASAPVEVTRDEYRRNAKADGISRDGLAVYWTGKETEGKWRNRYEVTKYYKRTFTHLEKVGAGTKYQIHGAKATVNLKDVGKLGDNVGGQGLAYNQKIGTAVFMFGYPSGSHPDGSYAFTGKTMKWSYGKTIRVAPIAAIKGEELIGIKSAFTGEGAIGSPWLHRYSNTKRLGYLNGVTIGVSDTDGNNRIDTSISTYFDGETLAVYNAAKGNASGKIV